MSLVTSNSSVWVKIARLQLNCLNSSQWRSLTEWQVNTFMMFLWFFWDFSPKSFHKATNHCRDDMMGWHQYRAKGQTEKACEKNYCFLIGCWSHLFYHAWSLVTRGYCSLQPPCRLSGAETLSKQRAAWWWKPSQTAAGAPQRSSFSYL